VESHTSSSRRGDKPFTGHWVIDLRTSQERKAKIDCASAEYELTQTGKRITGSHSMATHYCGRLNEGGPGTVNGVIDGKIAVLVVVSGRNGGANVGTATIRGRRLHWRSVSEIREGEPQGDSPLILYDGDLTHKAQQ